MFRHRPPDAGEPLRDLRDQIHWGAEWLQKNRIPMVVLRKGSPVFCLDEWRGKFFPFAPQEGLDSSFFFI